MNDPYKVLGVSPNATDAQIKEAYRELAKKYHPDKYAGNPLADLAAEKMQEINEAYNALTKGKNQSGSYTGGGYSQSGYGNATGGYSSSSYNTGGANNAEFNNVRRLINENRLDEAERIRGTLTVRNAQWHFLMGVICKQRGWYDKAYQQFARATSLDPYNAEYRTAFNSIKNSQTAYTQTGQGYGYDRTNDLCDACSTLLCLNCLCNSCGGGC